MVTEALSLLELDGVASGLTALDTMVKQAPVDVLEANLVEPGKFLILVAGGVAEVEESHQRAVERHEKALLSSMFLPMVHSSLMGALRGSDCRDGIDTIGVIEGTDVAGTLMSADRALKDSNASMVGIRVAVALGGRGYFLVSGAQHDVEAAIDAARDVLNARGALHRTECIARPHSEMIGWLLRPAPFQVG